MVTPPHPPSFPPPLGAPTAIGMTGQDPGEKAVSGQVSRWETARDGGPVGSTKQLRSYVQRGTHRAGCKGSADSEAGTLHRPIHTGCVPPAHS